jgi:probable LLM family oxidoreductase
MEIGIDSFAAADLGSDGRPATPPEVSIAELLERIVHADRSGLDVFGIGEHYRVEFLDSAPTIILAAAAAMTERITLTSAVSVLSAADPVRLFQQFATLDLIAPGRIEMVVGRGSFTEAFPLFGIRLEDYDEIFSEHLDLLMQLRAHEQITWSGNFRPDLRNQTVLPRPVVDEIPIWLGVGGSPESFIRAGRLGLPLMVAVIGGNTSRFRPLVDLYRQAWAEAGHPADKLKVGLHSPGYVTSNTQEALQTYFPGYVTTTAKIARERGWPRATWQSFLTQAEPKGAFVIGDPEVVAEKILHHSAALGGVDRFTFQMDIAGLSHGQLMESIALIGTEVLPLVRSDTRARTPDSR